MLGLDFLLQLGSCSICLVVKSSLVINFPCCSEGNQTELLGSKVKLHQQGSVHVSVVVIKQPVKRLCFSLSMFSYFKG